MVFPFSPVLVTLEKKKRRKASLELAHFIFIKKEIIFKSILSIYGQ